MFIDRLIPALVTIGFLEMIGSAGVAAGNDPFSAVPGSCNAIAVVHMRSLVNSPLGKRGKWFDKARTAYAEGLLSGPPWVKEIIQATTVGSANRGEPVTYSIYVMDRSSIITDIAKHEMASMEKLAGHSAVMSPRNVCFIQLANGLTGAMQPANRQAASAWVTALDEKQLTPIAPAIVDAIKADKASQVAIVVDLKGRLNPRSVLNWIVGTPKLARPTISRGWRRFYRRSKWRGYRCGSRRRSSRSCDSTSTCRSGSTRAGWKRPLPNGSTTRGLARTRWPLPNQPSLRNH